MSMGKRKREIEKIAAEFGRRVEKVRRNGHYMLICERGERGTVYAASTASCHRAMKNLIRDLKAMDKPKEPR